MLIGAKEGRSAGDRYVHAVFQIARQLRPLPRTCAMMLLITKLNEKALLPSLLGLPLVRLGFKRLDVSARLAAVGA